MLNKIKNKIKNSFEKIKYGLIYNKITTILSLMLVILLVIICFAEGVFEDNNSWDEILDNSDLFGIILIVPILYRVIGSLILKLLVKMGLRESTEYFGILTRIATMIACFGIFLITGAPFVSAITWGIFMGYLDKACIFVVKIVCSTLAGENAFGSKNNKSYDSKSSINDVSSLMNNSQNSFEQPDGTVVYKDSNGNTIGSSKYNEKTGETVYFNENFGYIGKSTKGVNNGSEFYDKNLNYNGKSVKESDGTTSYYDDKSDYKGWSKDNTDNTSNYHNN